MLYILRIQFKSDMQSEEQRSRPGKMKVEELFSCPNDDHKLSYCYTSNSIISSHSPIEAFLLHFADYSIEEQEDILKATIKALKQVSTNAYFLNARRPPDSEQESKSIIQVVIELMVQNVKNYLLFNLLSQFLELLLPTSSLKESLLEACTQRTLQGFYDGKVEIESIFGAISVNNALYAAKIEADKQPKNMMAFHDGEGLELLPCNKASPTVWKFDQGMTLMFWVYIDDLKFGTENKLPKLFTFYSPNKGGVESYLIDRKVYYRIIGSKYSEPQIGSNGICLGELECRKWNFICFEHEGNKVFMKSKLNFYVNQGKANSFSIDPPKIAKGSQTKYVFFKNFYGKTSSVGIFPHPIGSQAVEDYNRNINSIEHIKKTKALLLELKQGVLYERSGFGYSPHYVLQRDLSMDFKAFLPYFYLLRFVKEKHEYPAMNELLNLLVLFFRKSAKAQTEASSEEYLKLLAALIGEVRYSVFDENSVKSILHVKHTITDPQLFDQYFGDFLWPLIQCGSDWERVQELTEILKGACTQNGAHFQSVIGLDEMLNSLCRFEPRSASCCQKHHRLIARKVESQFNFEGASSAQRTTVSYILKLIETYFQNSDINFAEDCFKLCRLLTLKFSPCFTLELIHLIRKVVEQKLKEKISESQVKRILKYFHQQKLYLIFLHVIENNFFAEIKAECVKIIYKVLFTRFSEKEQMQLSLSISSALWKINEENQDLHHQTQTPQQIDNPISESSERVDSQTFQSQAPQSAKSMKIENEGEEEEYKEVGPIAPKLRNRDKAGKTFDFGFANKDSEGETQKGFSKGSNRFAFEEIVEEQKTNDFSESTQEVQMLPAPPSKKGKKSFGLVINTEEINEMYTFGGEKGKQVIVSEEQENAELDRIRSLAKICTDSMRNRGKRGVSGEEVRSEEGEEVKHPSSREAGDLPRVMPPPTTKNKTLQERKKKSLALNFINEEEEEEELPERQFSFKSPKEGGEQAHGEPSKVRSTSNKGASQKELKSFSSHKYSKGSNVSPTSNQSSTSEDNLVSLYNSLLECCLGLSFQTSMIEKATVQIPSVLCVFFQWIPQTELETKFLNDMEIVTEEEGNLEKICQLPDLYDFLCELQYKCLLMEEMGEKQIYAEKLEKFTKKVFSFVFREDPAGVSKFSFLLDWAEDKKEQYHPKSLTFCVRAISLLVADSLEEYLVMHRNNDCLMERNFQAMGGLVEGLLKFLPTEERDEFELEGSERVLMVEGTEAPGSIAPQFRTAWLDQTLCQKYFYLFNKYFSTQWYSANLRRLRNSETNFVEVGIAQLQKESAYYLRDNFLISLIEVTRALFLSKPPHSEEYSDLSDELIWQLVALIILSETCREKAAKNHRSERIVAFLKNCKVLAELEVGKIAEMVSIISHTKHFLAIGQMGSGSKAEKDPRATTEGFLDEIIQDYLPEELLHFERANSVENFRLHFADVWVPYENQKKRVRSELFAKYRQRSAELQSEAVDFIEAVSEVMERENERQQVVESVVEADRRRVLNKFRKLWQQERLYGRLWRIPALSLQVDALFNKTLYNYDKFAASPFTKFKISKHHSRAKVRYFLKPRLLESELELEALSAPGPAAERNEVHLARAISHIAEGSSVSISRSRTAWLSDKQNGLEVALPFKRVSLINTLTIRSGELAIINDKLLFAASFINEKPNHVAIKQYTLRRDKSLFKVWPLEYFKEVVRRRFVNRKKAVQITFIHGKSILLEFKDMHDSEEFFKKITKFKGNRCPNLTHVAKSADSKKIFENSQLLQKWQNYQMSNFEYLMELNNASGRSYADLTQYPVIPWVLINFKDQKLNLEKEESYRNLHLPMGALGSEQRTANFEERYNMLTIDDKEENKFHYGTHYSSPGIVYHFLIRLSPFTEGSILLQSGKFDFADRLFFSMADSYKNATSQHSDVRELLPELYTIPEVYLNVNKNDFGLMQSKKRVHNIELPEWSLSNPFLYVTKIRKAFQESFVSRNVNGWIDLIFGYKQRGQEAVDSLNKFYYLTYEDSVNWEKVADEKEANALEAQIINFGQTPGQIFTKPHPERSSLNSVRHFHAICDKGSQIKVYRPSKNKNLLQEEVELNPLRQEPESIVHMKWIKDDKLVFVRRNGQMLFYKWHLPNGQNSNKVPFQCAIEKEKKLQRMEKVDLESNLAFDPSLEVQSFPLEFVNKGSQVCMGGLLDGKLALIDTESNQLVEVYSQHEHAISCIRADSKDNFLLTGDVSGRKVMWRILVQHNSCKLVPYETFSDQGAQISAFFFSYELKVFAASSFDGSVFVYNLISGKKMRAYFHPHGLPINDVVISTNPLAAVVLFSNQEGLIYCYSLNGQLIQRVHEKESECFLTATLLRDSLGFEYVGYGNEHGETILRMMPYLDNPKKLTVAKEAVVNRICPSRNGKYLVSGCSDGELSVITDPNPVSAETASKKSI